MDVEEYKSKANQQLEDKNLYKKLNEYTATKHSDIVNSTIEIFQQQELLSTSTTKKLTTNDIRTPQLRILPKYINQTFQEDQS